MPCRLLAVSLLFAVCGCADVTTATAPTDDDGDGAEGEGEAAEGEGEGEAAEGEGEAAEGEGEGEGEPAEGEGEGEGEPPASRCDDDGVSVSCPYRTRRVSAGFLDVRDVHHQRPLGTPPPGGWPTVIFFQGSLYPADLTFAGSDGDVHGRVHLARTVKALLDAGFAVVAPEALGAGFTAWQTNVPPASVFWQSSADHGLVLALLAAIEDGDFGDLNADRLYAMGISSGGFMTSRMAVSYPGRFRALAVHSGGYATCSAVCFMPSSLPDDHPPTLFLHGATDLIVTPGIMTQYRDALDDDGVEVDTVLGASEGHEWLAGGVNAIPAWFRDHP